MIVVKFIDNTFAVRRGFFWYQYLDAVTARKWWNNTKYAKQYARLNTLEEAQSLLANYRKNTKDLGTPV